GDPLHPRQIGRPAGDRRPEDDVPAARVARQEKAPGALDEGARGEPAPPRRVLEPGAVAGGETDLDRAAAERARPGAAIGGQRRGLAPTRGETAPPRP